MYNRNYNNSYGGGGGYRSNNNGRGGGYSRQNTRQDTFKKSGCELRKSYVSRKTGEQIDAPILIGFNVSKSRGLIKFIATPRKDRAKRQTSNPDWENWYVKVQTQDGVKHLNGLFSLKTQKLIIPDLEMVANHKAPSGYTRSGKRVSGYFGRYYRTK